MLVVAPAIGISNEQLFTSLLLVGAAAEWQSILTWPRRKRQAGAILEDLGTHPQTPLVVFVGTCSLGAAIFYTSASVSEGTLRLRDLVLQGFFLSSAISAWVVARSRVYMTEQSILRFDRQVDWSDIESYAWTSVGEADVLIINTRRKRWFGREIRIEVPYKQRPVFEKWLKYNSSALQPANAE